MAHAEMKPEYNYGTAVRRTIGIRLEKLNRHKKRILKQLAAELPIFFRVDWAVKSPGYFGFPRTEGEHQQVASLLANEQIEFAAGTTTAPLIFPYEEFYRRKYPDCTEKYYQQRWDGVYDVPRYLRRLKRYFWKPWSPAKVDMMTTQEVASSAQSEWKKWDSLKEYSLRHWSEANQLTETYRLTWLGSHWMLFWQTVRFWFEPELTIYYAHAGHLTQHAPLVFQWTFKEGDVNGLVKQIQAVFRGEDISSWKVFKDTGFVRGDYIFESHRSGGYTLIQDRLYQNETAYQLSSLMNELVDLLEKQPDYSHFPRNS